MSRPTIAAPRFSADLLSLFDLHQPSLLRASEAAAAGSTEMALALAISAVRERLQERLLRERGEVAELDFSRAKNLLENRVSLLGTELIALGSPVNWFAREDQDQQFATHLGYFYWATSLARVYRATGDERFAEKWFELVEDFLTNVPYGTPLLEYHPSSEPLFRQGLPCNFGESIENRPMLWISLAAHRRIDAWLEALTLLSTSAAWSSARVGRILHSLANEHCYLLFANPRDNTPNQFLGGSLSLIRLAVVLPQLRIAASAMEIGISRTRRAIAEQVLADGSDLEQSPNYNQDFLKDMRSLAPDIAGAKDVLRFLHDAAARRLRYLLHIATPPELRYFDLAKAHAATFSPELFAWASAAIGDESVQAVLAMRAGASTEQKSLPQLEAVFPYGGYACFRTNWSARATWWCFKFSERGRGHMHEDCLSLCLTTEGRHLLVDSGHYSYTDQTELDQAMNAYSLGTESHSSVLIDGFGQNRHRLRKMRPPPRNEPLPLREQSCPLAAFVEGKYVDGYGPGGQIGATHHRRILWIKSAGWLVVDSITPGDDAAHDYQQRWMLGPAFGPEAVLSEQGSVPEFRTCIGGPGIQLRHFNPNSASAKIEHGLERPTRGWYTVNYQQRVPKPDLSFAWTGTGPQLVATWIEAGMLNVSQGKKAVNASPGKLEIEWGREDGFELRGTIRPAPTESAPEIELQWRNAGERVARTLFIGHPDGHADRCIATFAEGITIQSMTRVDI